MMDFDDLEGDFETESRKGQKTKAEKPFEKFDCQSCCGTGVYRGFRINQPETKCFACNGRGWFKKSEADRRASREKSAAKKAQRIADGLQALRTEHAPLMKGLSEIQDWNGFAASLLGQAHEKGTLSENQIAAGYRMIEKVAANRAAREAAKVEQRTVQDQKSGTVGDVSQIRALFDRVLSRGLKRPRLVFGDVELSLASPTGKNPGAIYVKRSGEYSGKIIETSFSAVRSAPEDTLAKLVEFAADPIGKAIEHGKRTGVCCCCGRELTDPVSIEKGIGPICEAKWF